MMVCDEEVGRLARAVIGGDVMAIALLLDRLYELGDKRGEHLHSAVGFLVQQVENTTRYSGTTVVHIRKDRAKFWTDLTSWIERAFWPEMHGGAVPALTKVEELLKEVL